jgi:hypothetical protein
MYVSSGGSHIGDQQGTLQSLSNARAFLTQQHGDNVLHEIRKTF